MKKVIATEKLPIKIWADEIDDNAIDQAKNLANLPFVFKHVALMPDVHLGYGMPIGGVLATKDVIIPNAVGSDIGCGMIATKLSLSELNQEQIKKIFSEVRQQIPVGFNKHQKDQSVSYLPTFPEERDCEIVSQEFNSALKQIGTLGGGNHFIEIQKGFDGFIWIMIHSGSRNLGKQIADHYNKIAIKLNERWCSIVPKEYQLAFLPVESKEGQDYLREMQYAVEFALSNRKLMMDRATTIIQTLYSCEIVSTINIAHNYASLENHFGENVWIHRKGATLARKDTAGIIPGSQGTKSYIVKGKDNPQSFSSCSHGAGRKMSRGEARKTLNLKNETARLDKEGIVHSIRTQDDLDEASGAYKDIDVVMENQRDLVEIVVELTPLGVIKG